MPRISLLLIVIIAIVYVVGARYPGLATRIGLA